jgi:acetyltransferase-like isoleucine patch superfamily enzyme
VSANINARHVDIGQDVEFGARVQIEGIGGPAERIVIGDNVRIGDDVRILVRSAELGDFTTIHHHTTIYGYADVSIGACGWIGQNATLNCTDALTLERGVTFGAYSAVYTHSSGGDVVQGFRFSHQRPAVLREDAFVAPHCFIAPVEIGARSMLLGGSVLTRSIPPDTTWGGNPAVDVTNKTAAPYKRMQLEEKLLALLTLLRQYEARQTGAAVTPLGYARGLDTYSACGITITAADFTEDGATSIFDLRDRTYSKVRTPEELAFMRFLLPHVKFYPRPR